MVDSAQLASQAFAKLQESTKWRPGPTVAAVLFFGGGVASWYAHLHRKKSAAVERAIVRVASTATLVKSGEHEKRRKVKVDKEFFRRLATLLKIVLPGMGSKEFFLLVLHTGFLIARTFASIYVASLDGQLVKSIVDRDPTAFMWRLLRWLGIAIPATYINSMIRYRIACVVASALSSARSSVNVNRAINPADTWNPNCPSPSARDWWTTCTHCICAIRRTIASTMSTVACKIQTSLSQRM